MEISGNDDIPDLRVNRHTGSPHTEGKFMPISNRARRTGLPGLNPDRSASRMNQVWPVVIALAAVIVFIVVLVLADPPMAVAMALTTLVAGAVLVTLVTGTGWLTGLRRLAPHLRGRH